LSSKEKTRPDKQQSRARFKKGKPKKRYADRGNDLIPVPGRRPVEELLQKQVVPELLVVTRKKHQRGKEPLLNRCIAAGWKVEEREKAELDQLSENLPHQGYIAFIREFHYVDLNTLLEIIRELPDPILVALDQIQDVGNLGAILRSAECAGISGVILPFHHSAAITAASIRRSAGAALHLPICRVGNLAHALDTLSELNFQIIGADQEGAQSIFQTDLRGSIVLVIGSEGKGLRPGIKRRCTELVSIPLKGRIASLNASAAAAVCFFEAVRQRIGDYS